MNDIISEFGLGEGEAEAIILFSQENADFLATDDHKAINACKIHDIPFITALTFVIESSSTGLITKNEVREMIRYLSIYGRYKDELIYKALSLISEKND